MEQLELFPSGTQQAPSSTLPVPSSTLRVPPGTLPAPSSTLRVPQSTVFVRHPKARRYILRVTREGIVRVTIPRWGSKREATLFANSQHRWIDKQLAKWQSERAAVQPLVPLDVRRQLVTQARRELPVRLLALAAAHGLTVARVSIRNQRWRWGSCSPNGHICLNWRLVTMPDWVRDYVLIHELMHLKRMDHSRKFWKLVAAACPRFREARAWLRDHRRDGL
jgi:predicted metal-dependent hydrolase